MIVDPQLLVEAVRALAAENERLRTMLRQAEAQARRAETAAQTFADLWAAHTPYEVVIPETEVLPCPTGSVLPCERPPSAT